MIKEWIESYQPKNKTQAQQALREIMQEIALAGLYRAGFFEKAAFYGGTALRIFYGLPRYSEDLDFSLLKSNPDFSFDNYVDAMLMEFEALGMKVSMKSKEKSAASSIESAFLKSETLWKELILTQMPIIKGEEQIIRLKIKLEIDTHPPLGFNTEEKLLLKPFSCYVKCFTLPDLFAGKMHALLYRKWKNRVKGRDWYDLEWYIRHAIPLNSSHFMIRAVQSGDWKAAELISNEKVIQLLSNKIKQVSFSQIKEDIIRFIPDPKVLDIWSENYFLDLIKHLKVE
ncbi:MAG: nucleotidyl transferase AbiEii/AbiGii toxin family protein [Bacteroidetes bacterium]|nr:nucleotidyl transferase AbiEii/AbiGii toxin family protein [Bacteroidota bacterium]HET6244679.1 nucleotidyl transferase AbiEii/AbiGii toxin family protein [Bacteroidia bacterium]